MRRRLWPRSFGAKITLLTTIISATAIVGVSVTLAGLQYSALRQKTLDTLHSQTHIVAMNSAAPLAFGDPESAREALAAFESLPAVRYAALHSSDGKRFALYGRPASEAELHASDLLGPLSHTENEPVEQKGQRLGSLEVVYDMGDLRSSFLSALALSGAVAVAAVILVLLTMLRARRILVQPMTALGHTAREVSRTKDYSHRAPKISDDEIGEFAEAFNQMLEQIQSQDRAIQESRADALRANQLKDEFLATLSHELRTPMAPIVGWAQILKLSTNDPAKVAQAAVVIERNARAQNKIIEDLLDMSRIVSGKIKLDIRDLDIAEAVNAAIETVSPSANAKRVELRADVARGVGRLRGDPNRLQQIVWNLLTNAIKFTPSGGSVEISLQRQTGFVEVSVSDTGQGIPTEFLPHIFERFRQADSSSIRQHGGLGLGLAIAKQLVELHGGTIQAASDGAGRGSRFTLRLPIIGQAVASADPLVQPRAEDAGAPLHGLRVLVVDDETDTRELVQEILRSSGASVKSCGSAKDALGALSEFSPDILVSDIAMPEVNGYDLLRTIRREQQPFRDMPAIALTAYAREEDRKRALDVGFEEHIAKPVENAAFIAAVARIASRILHRNA